MQAEAAHQAPFEGPQGQALVLAAHQQQPLAADALQAGGALLVRLPPGTLSSK